MSNLPEDRNIPYASRIRQPSNAQATTASFFLSAVPSPYMQLPSLVSTGNLSI